MFTEDQIHQAHSKVKSGADFPAYISDLKELGVTGYETFVEDGHTVYRGKGNYWVVTESKYAEKTIAEVCDSESFKTILKEHQQGKSDYPTFISQCAEFGVEKWVIDMGEMTCTYFDKEGGEVLVEVVAG